MIKDNCLFGRPRAQQGADLGPTRLVIRKGYVLEHSSVDKIPLWVCERSTKDELTGNVGRRNPFKPDPQLAGFPRAELGDYRGSGFDRGHMAPAGNQTVDRQLKDETFFLSNMAPQVGRTFNQGIWADLEDRVRDWTRARDESWIITGNMFYDPLEENSSTADGFVPYSVIGDGEVAVPTHCYKIIVAKDDGEWESVAFVIENETHARPFRIEDFIATVEWIEERTGLDFMPQIVSQNPSDPELENRLEATRGRLWDGEQITEEDEDSDEEGDEEVDA